MSSNKGAVVPIQSTAGAIPVFNDKGELSMQKVKVQRYVSGKRPEYAPMSSSEEENDDEDFIGSRITTVSHIRLPPGSPEHGYGFGIVEDTKADLREAERDDPRLKRLQSRGGEVQDVEEQQDLEHRYRRIHAPQILTESAEESSEEEVPLEEVIEVKERKREYIESESEEEEEELNEEDREKKRELLKQMALAREEQQELQVDEEGAESAPESEEESSEYEEESESEEDTGPRLKPVFVRKRERVTVLAKEKEAMKQRQRDIEMKKMADDRKKETLKLVEEEIRKETVVRSTEEGKWTEIITDDENDEIEYEAWKLRELKRVKRDKEEREQLERERMEIERIRTMTEEERRIEFRNNAKEITNKATKGKYKFLQKYYHRGAFFLDNEQDVYKRDFSAATLEDVFDKTILPKVMQVKNFGRSGRTKYTHLVDQDTTQFDSPWVTETAQNVKFHSNQAGGSRQTFNRPTVSKRKK